MSGAMVRRPVLIEPFRDEPWTSMLPILLSIPHGGTQQPPELTGRVCLSNEDLFDDSDAFTRDIYDLEARVAYVVTAQVARAFVDVNRAPDDRPPANPDGVVKSATCQGRPIYNDGAQPDDGLVAELLDRYYAPYHSRLERAAADPLMKLALDCHSMSTVAPALARDPGRARPLFCLSNGDGATCPHYLLNDLRRAIASTFECDIAQIRLNDPFKGGHITRTHGRGDVPWIQVEISRSFYLVSPWFDRARLSVDPTRLADLRDRFFLALRLLRL